jgi:PAS domain S-box-containing protein
LGRRVADIVTDTELTEGEGRPEAIIAGPAVVPFEAVPVAMLIADPAGEALGVNMKWVELSGISTMASLGSGWLEAVSPDWRSKLRADVRRVATVGTGLAVDYPRWSPTGRWTRWWLQAYERAGERLVGIAAADIAEHHKRAGRSCHSAPDHRTAPGSGVGRLPAGAVTVLAELPDVLDDLDTVLRRIGDLASRGRL